MSDPTEQKNPTPDMRSEAAPSGETEGASSAPQEPEQPLPEETSLGKSEKSAVVGAAEENTLPELKSDSGNKRQNKQANFRITKLTRKRLKIVKEDYAFLSLSWDEVFNLFIAEAARNGLLSPMALDDLNASGAKLEVPTRSDHKDPHRLAIRWPDVADEIAKIEDRLKEFKVLEEKIIEATCELALTVTATEEWEDKPRPEEAHDQTEKDIK